MNSSSNNSNAENCKVVLVGETGVGKTSIISRFCSNKFDTVFMPTPGASFTSKSVYIDEYDKIIKFEVSSFLNRFGILLDRRNTDLFLKSFTRVSK